jgi:hypothetical protein
VAEDLAAMRQCLLLWDGVCGKVMRFTFDKDNFIEIDIV